jgi:hypothetical protein
LCKTASFTLAALLLVTAGCGATNISLAPTILRPIAPVREGPELAVAQAAEGVPDTIGYGTVSVFAIPAIPVRFSDPDPPARIMESVRQALRVAGYKPVRAAEPPAGPVLRCRISEMRFRNYTWLMPAIQTWGNIRLTLALVDKGEKTLWHKDYEGRYSHGGVSGSFDVAVNEAMGTILARAAEDFTGSEFRRACCDASP